MHRQNHKSMKKLRNAISAEERAQLFEDWVNGAYCGELADAYGISSTRAYHFIDQEQRARGLDDDELQEIRMSREAERQRHTYSLDPDVDEWLRQQKDVGRVLNCALRLIIEQEKERKRMKKTK